MASSSTVGAVCGQMARPAVLARVEAGDLPVESRRLLFEVGQVVPLGEQRDVRQAPVPPRSLP